MRELPPNTRPCHRDGTLDRTTAGFSRAPFGPVTLAGRFPRKKRWDYWCITHPGGALSVVVADVDFLGLAAVAYFDFDTHVQTERASVLPFGWGSELPDELCAPTRHRSRHVTIDVHETACGTHIEASGSAPWGAPIEATLWIAPPDETLNLVVPMAGDAFQINAKHAARRALGDVRIGDRVITLRDGAFAARDWGRGVWPYDTRWNWACASGMVGAQTVGLNLGGAWTDGTGVTENAITIDGKVHVVSEDLRWSYDRERFSDAWRITDRRGKVDVRVSPFWLTERGASVGVLRSELHLVWARFAGHVEADDGARVAFDGLLGWAEEHAAHW